MQTEGNIDRERAQQTAQRFMALGLTAEGVTALGTVEELLRKLRDEAVVRATSEFMDLMQELTHFTPDAAVSARILDLRRVTFASFMTSYFPTTIFESMGGLETDLLNASRNLTGYIEALMPRLASTEHLSTIPLGEFSPLMDRYLHVFYAWKTVDAPVLAERVITQLVRIYQVYPTIPMAELDASNLRTLYAETVRRLRRNVVTLCGPTKLTHLDAALTARGLTIHRTLGV